MCFFLIGLIKVNAAFFCLKLIVLRQTQSKWYICSRCGAGSWNSTIKKNPHVTPQLYAQLHNCTLNIGLASLKLLQIAMIVSAHPSNPSFYAHKMSARSLNNAWRHTENQNQIHGFYLERQKCMCFEFWNSFAKVSLYCRPPCGTCKRTFLQWFVVSEQRPLLHSSDLMNWKCS